MYVGKEKKSHFRPVREHWEQDGLVSSHFLRLILEGVSIYLIEGTSSSSRQVLNFMD